MPACAGAPVLLNRDGLYTVAQVIAAQDAVEVVDLVGDEAGNPAVKDGDAPTSGDVLVLDVDDQRAGKLASMW